MRGRPPRPADVKTLALAAALEIALRRLCFSERTSRDWTLFEGRVEGIDDVAACLRANGRGEPDTSASTAARSLVRELARSPDRDTVMHAVCPRLRA